MSEEKKWMSMSIKEAAAHLGISRSTMFRLTKNRTFKSYKVRGKVYYDMDQWDETIKNALT